MTHPVLKQAPRHEDYEGAEVQLHAFLTSVLDGGEGPASRPSPITSGTHSLGGWVGSRAGLNTVAKGKNPCPCRESDPGLAVHNSSHYTD